MSDRLEKLCIEKGLKMTEQRRVIARVLAESHDHPDVELVYQRAVERDPRISIATVYRTVTLFEEASILERHDFGDEIGSASCRERVCKYVLLLVVDGSLKKKKIDSNQH